MSCKPACPTCERLRAAALELVGEGGAPAVTVERLAELCGLTPEEVVTHYRKATDCLYATYDEVACGLLLDLVDAFGQGSDWQTSLELSNRRLVERMAASPALARLCFVETVRGDRELRRRRDIHRRWVAKHLASEYASRELHGEDIPDTQFEMLVSAHFQAISDSVANGSGCDFEQLRPKLSEIAGYFIPVSV